ncbi:MAG: competence/damage-inducible protein A [Syntrophales bacterium]|jgi:nicotinamide-nucleotide amidase|nr:competence/damage-inducible protein A [Syntrophales bacterium]MCK9528146.1 competence/damage-inducible protein A [Syntrophales bacterium]MDX9921116.1 competence/damage-inducible protein A [Syntrophales bacterium]
MKAGLLIIGDELTGGSIPDVNSSFIAGELDLSGWDVSTILLTGDDPEAIANGLEYLLSRSDAVIVSGGLGPTADDITTAAIAAAFNLPLDENREILARLKERFSSFGIPWTENNAKQAWFPRGAGIIENPAGTAPGFYLKREDKAVIVVPGVPREVRQMVPRGVLPLLERDFPVTGGEKARKTIRIFGLSESRVDEIIAGMGPFPGVTLGFYPRFPENHLVLLARGRGRNEAVARLDEAARRIHEALGPYIYGLDDETLEGVVARILTERALTLSVAESFTGGLITDRLTDIPGSSLFLERGVVAYSNESKVHLLGVPPDVIQRHGAVSRETARLMARGIRASAGTDLGLSTTGIAGPSGGSAEKPLGTVYIALADRQRVVCRKARIRRGRRDIKKIGSSMALEMVHKYLTGTQVCDE